MTFEIVAAGAARLGIALGPEQLSLMARFVAFLLERNQRLNLTRIVDPAEVERRHLLDSLTCALPVLDALRAGAPWRCIDVGSGGGLPGIPLAIAFPGLQVTLLESVGKKAAFLRDAVADLGLTTVAVRTGRAEDAAREPPSATPTTWSSRGRWRRSPLRWSCACRSRSPAASSCCRAALTWPASVRTARRRRSSSRPASARRSRSKTRTCRPGARSSWRTSSAPLPRGSRAAPGMPAKQPLPRRQA